MVACTVSASPMTSMASTMRSLTAATAPAAVAVRVPPADLGHLVGEAGPLEVAGVAVDDGVGEEVAPGVVDALVALAHAGVHVGVDGGVAAGPHLLDRPRHVRGGQVVEQHAVGELAGQGEHAAG